MFLKINKIIIIIFFLINVKVFSRHTELKSIQEKISNDILYVVQIPPRLFLSLPIIHMYYFYYLLPFSFVSPHTFLF